MYTKDIHVSKGNFHPWTDFKMIFETKFKTRGWDVNFETSVAVILHALIPKHQTKILPVTEVK